MPVRANHDATGALLAFWLRLFLDRIVGVPGALTLTMAAKVVLTVFDLNHLLTFALAGAAGRVSI